MAFSPLSGAVAEAVAAEAGVATASFSITEADPAAPAADPATGAVGANDPPQGEAASANQQDNQVKQGPSEPSAPPAMTVIEEGTEAGPLGTTTTGPGAHPAASTPSSPETPGPSLVLGTSGAGWASVSVAGLEGAATVEVVAAGACDPLWTDELAEVLPQAAASYNGDGTSTVFLPVDASGTWELTGVWAHLVVSASLASPAGEGLAYAEGSQASAAQPLASGDVFDAYNRHIIDGNCPVIQNATSGGTALCADSRRAAPGTVTETGTWPAASFSLADPWALTTRSGVVLGSVQRQLDYLCATADYGTEQGIYAAQYAVWTFTNPDRFSYGSYAHFNAEICAMVDAANAYASSGSQEHAGRAAFYVPQGNGSYYDTWLQYLVMYAPPTSGSVDLWKASAAPGLTEGNPYYSLAGATYGVYAGPECSAEQRVAGLVTDEEGHARADGVPAGTYYVKEETASPGYRLDTAVRSVEVRAGQAATLSVAEVPVADPPAALVQKLDAATGRPDPQGAGELAGAEFTVAFYAGRYDRDSLPAQPTRTWVFRTNENGFVYYLPENLVSGDALYTDGSGHFTLPLGTVAIRETKAPTGYLPDDTLYVDQVTEANGTAVLNTRVVAEQPVLGGLSLVKQDEGGNPLAGAVFEVVNATGGVVDYDGRSFGPGETVLELTTGEDGRASTADHALPVGNYTVREKSAPEGYVATGAEQTVAVREDGAVVPCGAPFVNERARGGLALRKIDDQTADGSAQGSSTLADAVFEVRDEEGRTVATLVTDAQGRAATGADELPLGTYRVVETQAPRGYAVPASEHERAQVVELTEPAAVAELSAPFRDRVLRGGLSVQKADLETGATEPQGEASLGGAAFAVSNASTKPVVVFGATYGPGETVLTLTTDASGHAETPRDALPFGSYTVTETAAPQGYLLNSSSWTVEIAEEGALVPVGDFQVASAPAAEEPRAENPQDPVSALASLFAPTAALAAEAEREPAVAEQVVRGGVRVHKVDADTGLGEGQGDATLEGTEFSITTMNEHPVVVGGRLYERGSVVMKIYTDASGMAQTGKRDLPYGVYAVAETSAPIGYHDFGQMVEVSQDGVIVDVGREFEDEVKRGGVCAQKVDADLGEGRAQGSATLAGTVFEVVNASENTVVVDGFYYEKGEVVATMASDASGYAQTGNRALPFGTYLVREASSPAGYLPGDGTSQTVEVREDGVVAACEEPFANGVRRGGIELAKVDADSRAAAPQGDATLAGAVFEVRNANSQPVVVGGEAVAPGKVAAVLVTDELGRASTGERELPVGTYTVAETVPPQGYRADPDPQSVTVTEDGAVVACGRGFEEAALRGGVEIAKADAELPGGAPQGDASLAGAVFEVVNASQNPVVVNGESFSPGQAVATLVTDGAGRASTDEGLLPFGTYIVREVSAPAGYRLGEAGADGLETGLGREATVEVHSEGFCAVAPGALRDSVARGGLSAQKADADLGENQPQGSATLAGAVFEVVNASRNPVVVGEDAFGPGEVVARIATDESGLASTGSRDLPYGTYEVREAAAPAGYLPGDGSSQVVEVREEGVVAACAKPFPDAVERGGFGLRKVDSESGEASAQGDATLEGAVFAVISENDNPVAVGGATYRRGDVVATLTTDRDGWAQVPGSSLPVGTYTVVEVAPPAGYLAGRPDPDRAPAETGPSFSVEIEGQGFWRSFESGEAADQVVRGGLSLRKADAETPDGSAQGAAGLAGAVFEVVNASASPVAVGGVSRAPGEVVATLVTDEAGFASTGSRDLPYGTYEVREVEAPRGYLPDGAPQLVSVREEGVVVACGGDFREQVVRGGVSLRKVDSQTGERTPQGSATLAGAVFAVASTNPRSVVVNGEAFLPGDTVARLVTDEAGFASTGNRELPYGTYEVREEVPPQGYLPSGAVWSVAVEEDGVVVAIGDPQPINADKPAAAEPSDPLNAFAALFAPSVASADEAEEPAVPEQVVRGGVRVRKVDAQTGEAVPQGGATLAGTRFQVTSLNERPVVVGGASFSFGEVVLVLEAGPDGVAQSAPDALPYGTYEVREVEAPAGYLPGDEGHAQVFSVTEQGAVAEPPSPFANQVKRGGIRVQKTDDATGGVPQGAAALAGAVFEVVNANANPVLTDGVSHGPGEVVATLTTDDSGQASTPADLLPVGTYEVREAAAPTGYLATAPAQTVVVGEQGEVVSAGSPFANRVMRGDFKLVKVREADMARLAGVPFLVTSATTGESHVAVTDANGELSSASSWAPHSGSTNANDAAVSPGGDSLTVDESLLKPGAGLWFSGLADGGAPADDARGALPYDTYTLRELPCAANAGLRLVTIEFSVYRDSVTVDLGTVDDRPAPVLATELTAEDGAHEAFALGTMGLVDTVAYSHFEPGTYTATLELVFPDGSPLLNEEGELVQTSVEVHLEHATGEFQVPIEVDASQLAGRSLVALETVYDGQGNPVASHRDLLDGGQTVSFSDAPQIATALSGPGGQKVLEAQGTVELADLVSYSGLIADGRAYTVVGTLVDKATGEPVVDGDGRPVETRVEGFVPDAPDGEVALTFRVPGDVLCGRAIVAFERVFLREREVAAHADLDDEDQSAWVPSIATSLAERESGLHMAAPDGAVELVDTVTYSGLRPKETYRLRLTLVDRATGEALRDGKGEPVASEVEFAPEEAQGLVEVTVAVDASSLAGCTVVAFESLALEGRQVASHADLADEAQSVRFPELSTELTGAQGGHVVAAGEPVGLVDRVSWANLEPGRDYLLSASLWDAEDAAPLAGADGAPLEASTAFRPEGEAGTTEVLFAGVVASGRRAVCFEELSVATAYGEDGEPSAWTPIASHRDLADSSQTVSFGEPLLRTCLTDDATGLHETRCAPSVVLTDEVSYEGLVEGAAYTLVGALYDKASGDPLAGSDGTPAEARIPFVAEGPAGTVRASFAVDTQELGGATLVAFERVLDEGGAVVAAHEELEDARQAVRVVGMRTTAFDASDGDHEVPAAPGTVLSDRVELCGVEPGATYTVETEIADAASRATVASSSAEVAPSREETAFTVSATVDTSALAGRDLVFLETLRRDGKTVAQHRDYGDVRQTVRVGPWVGTELTDRATGYHEAAAEGEVTLVDVVEYRGLEASGAPYTLVGSLVERASGNAVADAAGNPVCAQATFTPEGPDGRVEIAFTFDASRLAPGTQVVCLEELYDRNGRLAASHADPDDASQTVTFRAPGQWAPPGTAMPQTGQGAAWAALLAAGAAALAAGAALRRRKGGADDAASRDLSEIGDKPEDGVREQGA